MKCLIALLLVILCPKALADQYIRYPAVGGGGVSSINGDTTAAQLIVGGTGITVGTTGGTTTIQPREEDPERCRRCT